MPTVVVRFEPCKKDPVRGTIYYHIYPNEKSLPVITQ